jgi:hypothetical protein
VKDGTQGSQNSRGAYQAKPVNEDENNQQDLLH